MAKRDNARLVRWALVLFLFLSLTTNAIAQSSTQAVTINYGLVTAVGTVQKDAKHAGGALAGGMIGALVGPRRHRGLRIAAGAAAGAAVQGAATSGTLQQYTVELVSGGTSVVSTEQTDIRVDDCVSVEQGQYANIRRVSGVHCDGTGPNTPPPHHQKISESCDKAKTELTNANTDDTVEMAMKKVRVLCED
jgi:outer membrane lipoprotein SlyB